MKDHWIGSNVDLALLVQRAKQFFEENQFETELEQAPGRFKIQASNSIFRVTVNVYGRPEDFTVEFIPNKKTQGFSLSMLLAYVTMLFGGGGFLLKDIRQQEAASELEEMFWKDVDKHIAETSDATQKGTDRGGT